jgi:hypothetical protein
MTHAAILTGGFPIFLIEVAKVFFSFLWPFREPYSCSVVDPQTAVPDSEFASAAKGSGFRASSRTAEQH